MLGVGPALTIEGLGSDDLRRAISLPTFYWLAVDFHQHGIIHYGLRPDSRSLSHSI